VVEPNPKREGREERVSEGRKNLRSGSLQVREGETHGGRHEAREDVCAGKKGRKGRKEACPRGLGKGGSWGTGENPKVRREKSGNG